MELQVVLWVRLTRSGFAGPVDIHLIRTPLPPLPGRLLQEVLVERTPSNLVHIALVVRKKPTNFVFVTLTPEMRGVLTHPMTSLVTVWGVPRVASVYRTVVPAEQLLNLPVPGTLRCRIGVHLLRGSLFVVLVVVSVSLTTLPSLLSILTKPLTFFVY